MQGRKKNIIFIKNNCSLYCTIQKKAVSLYYQNQTITLKGAGQLGKLCKKDMIINVEDFRKKGEGEFEFIYRERMILYSVDKKIFTDSLREAKEIARTKCKEQKCHVEVYHHSPFEICGKYISIYYGKRLKYFYLHEDALCAKRY